MRSSGIILLVCFSLCLKAQSPFTWFNTAAFWNRMVLDGSSAAPVISREDTVMAMASTRILQKDSFRFAGELRDGRIRYFLVYSSGGKWHILERSCLSEVLQYMPDRDNDWVLYTEGMGKIFTNNVDRGMQMAAQHHVNVLLFDYPSIRTDKGSLGNYRFAVKGSRTAYKDFIPLLDSVRVLKETGRLGKGALSLFFHSMGNNVLREVAGRRRLQPFNGGVWADNIILNAPCVPRRKHGSWIDRIHFAKRIYIHYNNEDGTLKWARLASFRQILGEHVKKPLSTHAIYVNFNLLTGDGHSNFLWLYGRPKPPQEAMQHYNTVLHGKPAEISNRALYAPARYRNAGLDLLPLVR